MDLHPKQFVRVNVGSIKAEEDSEKIVDRNFSVDPRTITLDRLRHLVARALDVRGEFWLVWRKSGSPLTCDWDLEAVLSEEPRIELTLQMQPREPGLEEWDIICPADVPVAGHEASPTTPRPRRGSFLGQLLHLYSPHPQGGDHRAPLTRSEFCSLTDWPRPLRYAVYRAGGAEPDVRPALWMHLLDVFPAGTHHAEREEFLNRKSEEYYGLRHSWQRLVRTGSIPAVVRDVTCLVRKDVRRTDRTQLQDSDQRALYNVLTTYALHHPSVGYRQGMSDLLSPLMHVMRTEARAYVALCGLMLRMRDNFRSWRSLRTKFRHLRRLLRSHDPALHRHLKAVGAIDLLFCYRWLLLDLKREFPYHEMMTLTEVMWATLRPAHREKGVQLYETRFPAAEASDPRASTVTEKTTRGLTSEGEDIAGQSQEAWKRTSQRCATKRRASRRQSSATRDIESEDASSSSDGDDDRGEKADYRHRRRRRRSRNDSGSRPGRSHSLDFVGSGRREEAGFENDTISELHDISGSSFTILGRRPYHSHSLDDRYHVTKLQLCHPRASDNNSQHHQQTSDGNQYDVIGQQSCGRNVSDSSCLQQQHSDINHDTAQQLRHLHSSDDRRGQQQPCASVNGRMLAEEPCPWTMKGDDSGTGRDDSSDVLSGQRQPCHDNTIHETWPQDSDNNSTDHRRRHGSSDSNYGSTLSDFDDGTASSRGGRQSSSSSSEGYDSQRTLTERDSSSEDDVSHRFPFDSVDLSSCGHPTNQEGGRELLPPPTRLGDGKPFLLFLCLVMLQGQREVVLERRMDASEIGIHFDRMARKHRLADVLPRAREMFEEYLRSGWTEDD